MSSDAEQKPEYFFNARTKMVEKGRLSSWEDVMGPYDTPEEAQLALETANKRSKSWDDADDKWRGEGS
ncbi:hypothetical protein [Demequina aurantiaca]|uniref:hypothetical protein n=1 Tax=Demequina aurantiaca TaxID=676200 RepID=UPI003D354EB7